MQAEAPTVSEIARWSVADRIQFVEDIWDTLAAMPQQLPVTDAQRAELDSRLHNYQQNPMSGSSWEEVKQRVTGRA